MTESKLAPDQKKFQVVDMRRSNIRLKGFRKGQETKKVKCSNCGKSVLIPIFENSSDDWFCGQECYSQYVAEHPDEEVIW